MEKNLKVTILFIDFSKLFDSVQRGKMGGLVSLFNGISTLCRLFNAKSILEEQ